MTHRNYFVIVAAIVSLTFFIIVDPEHWYRYSGMLLMGIIVGDSLHKNDAS